MKYKIKNIGDREVEVTPKVQLYPVTDFIGNDLHGLAITLDWLNPDSNQLEPFATLTVSFGEFIGVKNCAYVDTNNCQFADQFIELGIASDTGLTKQSGFCKYPLWKFNEEFLKEHGAENYQFYSEEYDKYMKESFGCGEEEEISEESEETEQDMKM